MSILKKLAIEHKSILSESDFQIIELLDNNITKIPTSTISEISDISFTSSSTLFRLVKKIGFKSYNEFKYRIKSKIDSKEDLESSDFSSDFLREISNKISWTDIISKDSIEKAAYAILRSKNLYFYATGWKQSKIGESLITDFNLYNIHFETIRSIDEFQKIKLDKQSLVLILSYSGDLNYIKKDIIELKNKKVKIVGISMFSDNQLSKLSDYSIQYSQISFNNESYKHWNVLTIEFLMEKLLYEISLHTDIDK